MRKLLSKINTPLWLEILLLVLLVLRIPSLLEPYYYGDEMIYLTLGNAIRLGKTLYLDIYDNKPPLLYIIAAIAGSVFGFRLILAFWSLATVVIFWLLVKAIFPFRPEATSDRWPKKEKMHAIATIIFGILTTIPKFEGNIANAEIFMMGPILLAFLILFTKKANVKNLFFSGSLLGIAALFKIPAAFEFPVILVFWTLTLKSFSKVSLYNFAKKTIFLAIGFAIPLLIGFIWFWSKGALGEYVKQAFLENVGYLSSFRPEDTVKPFWIRNFPLLMRGAIVGIGVIILFLTRKILSKRFIFVSLWLLFTLFAITLSERPYPHYLLQAFPALSILFGVLFLDRSIEQSLSILPISLFFLVPFYFNYWKYPTFLYYQRFLAFATQKIDRDTYLSSFGPNVTTDYEISNFVANSTRETDSVFVSDDSSVIYALSRRLPPIRFVADYHLNDFMKEGELIKILSSKKPKLIIILPNSPNFEEIYPLLRTNYIQAQDIHDAEIWVLVADEVLNSLPKKTL
ncbi:hypothetical protein M1545_03605 [Patescibacteria group bacterium]|nr:hypothetical protein [Patescibacteria group bacterium]